MPAVADFLCLSIIREWGPKSSGWVPCFDLTAEKWLTLYVGDVLHLSYIFGDISRSCHSSRSPGSWLTSFSLSRRLSNCFVDYCSWGLQWWVVCTHWATVGGNVSTRCFKMAIFTRVNWNNVLPCAGYDWGLFIVHSNRRTLSSDSTVFYACSDSGF